MFHSLEILSKAIHFKNLSGAAGHIGMSQPQLSRVLRKLEEEYQVQLLDRSSKRKSNWTPWAFELVKIYQEHQKSFQGKILNLTKEQMPLSLKMGSLEGMQLLALDYVKKIFDQTEIKNIELDIYDLNQLEGFFLSGELDIIFTMREPLKAKYPFVKILGYQKINSFQTNKNYQIFSTFEYQSLQIKKKKQKNEMERVLISNSLHLRQYWLKKYGGSGSLPSPIESKKVSVDSFEVYMVAAPTLYLKLWEILNKI